MADVVCFTGEPDIYAILHENSHWARLSLVAGTTAIYYYPAPGSSDYTMIYYNNFCEALKDLSKVAEDY